MYVVVGGNSEKKRLASLEFWYEIFDEIQRGIMKFKAQKKEMKSYIGVKFVHYTCMWWLVGTLR